MSNGMMGVRLNWVTMAVVAIAAAGIAWGSWLAGGGGTSAVDKAGVVGHVSYIWYNAQGEEVERWGRNNTVNDEGLNDTWNLITSTGSGGYDGIAALSADVGTDDPADGVLAGSIALTLDGDGVAVGDQNPADGSVTSDFGTETGNGTVVVTFTANAAVTIDQIVLTRATEDDTGDGAVAIADADIFAYIDVPNVSLGNGDSVQYTWTIDVD